MNFLEKIKEYIQTHKWLVAGVAVLLLVAGYLAFIKDPSSQEEALQFEHPQQRTLTKTLEVSGIIDAKKKAQLRFLAGGKIVYLGAQEGDWVKKWQTIATIDQRDLQKRLDKTLNNYMKKRWDWEQTLDDTEDRWLPKSEERQVDQEQWNLENTVLDVEIQSIAISNTRMSAPFAGVLVQSPVSSEGVQILATDYFELVDPESLIFKAEVDEEDVVHLNIGQTASLTLDAYDQTELSSNISYISYRSLQTSSGTVFLVELPLQTGPEGLNKFRLGMNGNAEILLDQKPDALSIPLIAIIQREGKNYVEIKDGQEIKQIQVDTGLETDQYIEITQGLDESDLVVIPGNGD